MRLGLVFLASVIMAAVTASGETGLFSFEGEAVPASLKSNSVDVELVKHAESQALRVHFEQVDWPNIMFLPADGSWDWTGGLGLAVDLFNPETESVDVIVRVDNPGSDGATNCLTGGVSVAPGQSATLRLLFTSGQTERLWGMRGLPVLGPISKGFSLDLSQIVAFQIFLPKPTKARTLIVDNIRLLGEAGASAELVSFPFIDCFGQYKHEDWPGKVHEEAELGARAKAEAEALKSAEPFVERDQYGGWANGPTLKATGWFRTAKVDGAWWLVTPEGRLFFSNGVDCVGVWERTFIEKREDWFEWLPEADGPFKEILGYTGRSHSWADPIDGKGRNFSFYCANLMRKYGDGWQDQWRHTTYGRLNDWGFNTIANWSQEDVLQNSSMPFTATINISGDFRLVEGGTGYWSKMKDPFDPGFEPAVNRSVASRAKTFANNPLCIGYFVDNELSWGAPESLDLAIGPLASPPDQPCRKVFVERLRARYPTIAALNAAWGTEAESWDALRAPAQANGACREDMEAFMYEFSLRYFSLINSALKKAAPNQLYLGCRFAWSNRVAVRACAEVADVVSFNIYRREVDPADWTGDKDLGKPLIIGEFHFGALDRGMFHTGLVGAADQKERAESYAHYVRSVADCSAFVGCHWFQYVDEPVTGRTWDGENYNIGFVDVTDSPYPELVAAAKGVHAEVYGRHSVSAK